MWFVPLGVNLSVLAHCYMWFTRGATVRNDGMHRGLWGGSHGQQWTRASPPGSALHVTIYQLPVTQQAPQPLCVSISLSSIRDHHYLLHTGLLRGFKQDNPFKELITLPGTTKCAINVSQNYYLSSNDGVIKRRILFFLHISLLWWSFHRQKRLRI